MPALRNLTITPILLKQQSLAKKQENAFARSLVFSARYFVEGIRTGRRHRRQKQSGGLFLSPRENPSHSARKKHARACYFQRYKSTSWICDMRFARDIRLRRVRLLRSDIRLCRVILRFAQFESRNTAHHFAAAPGKTVREGDAVRGVWLFLPRSGFAGFCVPVG